MTRPPETHRRAPAISGRELGPWFHNLHLPDGSQTAPDHQLGDFPAYKWREVEAALPADIQGWSALDIGCNAGFYSFELARRGARVTAVDSNGHYLHQARWAAKKMGLQGQVKFHREQLYQLGRWNHRYDLVLFMGLLYHLRYPLLGLDIACRLTGGLLVLQSLTFRGAPPAAGPGNLNFRDDGSLLREGWPKMAFIEHRLAGDPTNWWVPNVACVEAMVRSAGMDIVSRPGREIYLCRRVHGADWGELEAVLGKASPL